MNCDLCDREIDTLCIVSIIFHEVGTGKPEYLTRNTCKRCYQIHKEKMERALIKFKDILPPAQKGVGV